MGAWRMQRLLNSGRRRKGRERLIPNVKNGG
jgi:hypothetical protein